jgi:glucose/arabinose dehydrogenase
MKLLLFQTSIAFLSMLSCSSSGNRPVESPAPSPAAFAVTLKLVAAGLDAPVGMAVAYDGTNRLFVIGQKGKIHVIKDGKVMPVPFLDLSTKVDWGNNSYSEKGLLGLAFHPQFRNNGKFYVYYSAPGGGAGADHKSMVEEYTVSDNPDAANLTARKIIEIDQPESNHNGGQLAFGPDGFLYLGLGDGGGSGDRHGSIGNGQDLKSLLGKILRIDVNTETGYRIPADNPFVNAQARPEIFAYGLRNPWRFSFDLKTGQLFCADVGQNKWEEVNLIEKGKNYGWRIMEGNHCYDPPQKCNQAGLARPIAEYDHSEGKSVTGGYVYRGQKFPDLQGKYIFADWTGKLFMLSKSAADHQWTRYTLALKNSEGDFYINSFGEDESGELYVLGQSAIGPNKAGKIFRLEFD